MKASHTALSVSFATLATGGLLLACAANNPGPAVPGTGDNPGGVTEAQKAADANVVERLAAGRCDQEQTCHNIGPGGKYVTRDVCMQQMRGSIGNDLNAYNCPRGLDAVGVDRCRAAISAEECNHPFDTLSRFDTCRTGAMCMR